MRLPRTLLSLTLLLFLGCGSEEDRVKLVPVTGTVTLNGKPLAGAKISLVPAQTNKIPTPGIDETGPNGNFTISFKNRAGVAPGNYKVVILPPITLSGGSKFPEEIANDPYMAQLALGSVPGAEKKQPEFTKSEFDLEVGEQGEIDLTFDVKGRGPVGSDSSKN